MTLLSYIAAATFWESGDVRIPWLAQICLVIILISTAFNVFFAIKSKHYDLWAAAVISLISIPTLFLWAVPFFSERNREW